MEHGKTLNHGPTCNDDGIILCFGWALLPLVSLAGWTGDGILYHCVGGWLTFFLVWRSRG